MLFLWILVLETRANKGIMARTVFSSTAERDEPVVKNTSSTVKDVNMILGVDCDATNLTEDQVVL